MIRVEVASEADATRMTAAFQVLEALRDQDYEIWLLSGFGPGGGAAVRRAWRQDGLRGGTGTNAVIFYAGDPPGNAGTGGGGGTSYGETGKG